MVLWSGCHGIPFAKGWPGLKTPSGAILPTPATPATAATVSASDSVETIPLQPGMKITVETPTVTPTKADPVPTVTLTEHREAAKAAVAFAPPAPPTPADVAEGNGVRYFYLIAAGCTLVALLAAYAGHLKAAGIFGLAAIGIPILIHLGQNAALVHFLEITLAVGTTLIVAWYLVENKASLAPLATEAEQKLAALHDRLTVLEKKLAP